MTFEQFQATRKWSDDLAAAVQSAPWGDESKVSGQLYSHGLYIEAACNIEGATGEYLLTLGNIQTFGDLESLERDLYAFAVSEGYFE